MVQRGVVQAVFEGIASVAVGGGAGCGTCNARESCMTITGKKPEAKLIKVRNTLNAAVGDAVELELPASAALGIIALTFLLPVALLIIGYWIMIPAGSTRGALGAVGGLAVGMGISLAVNRMLEKKSAIRVQMTAIVQKECSGTDVSN